MASRRVLYRLRQMSLPFTWLRWLIIAPINRRLFASIKLKQVGMIALVDGSFKSDLEEAFVGATVAALSLIERHDPRHFRLVEREVRYIVNQELVAGASYDHSIRQCKIDFGRCCSDSDGKRWTDPASEHYEWHLARYASTLVHEAVHGRLMSLHFAYTRETRVRIERICVTEERRFLSHLPRDQYDFTELIPKFDPGRWEAYWQQNRWQYKKQLIRRIRDVVFPSRQ